MKNFWRTQWRLSRHRFWLVGLLSILPAGSFTCAVAAENAPVHKIQVEGVLYHVLIAEPDQVNILWADDSGAALRTFPRALKFLRRHGQTPIALMNGGIFEPRGIPSGLLIQQGRLLHPLNLDDGEGNFFLKPNGVFFISQNGKAQIVESTEFAKLQQGWGKELPVRCAVQSGPLLLRDGEVHPRFRAESGSRLHRNGIGVREDGRIILAITDWDSPKFPNLHDFAVFFREQGCRDALFLDGDLSRMDYGEDLGKAGSLLGSMIAVLQPRDIK